MKKRAKLRMTLLLVLIWTLLMPARIFASEAVQPDKEVSLTIQYMDNGTALNGAIFDIYPVAMMEAENVYKPTEKFAELPVDLADLSAEKLPALAVTLDIYCSLLKLEPLRSGEIDEQGTLTFGDLDAGLYLVRSHRLEKNGCYYTASPVLVFLPGLDAENKEWIYDVTVAAKMNRVPVGGDDVSRRVLKIWDDDGREPDRPKEIRVHLLRNGEIHDTVVLNAKNNWRHVWNGLDENAVWSVAEEVPTGYRVSISQEGTAFVITNSKPGEVPPPPPYLPQTGQLWWPVPVLAIAGMILFLTGYIRNRGACDED